MIITPLKQPTNLSNLTSTVQELKSSLAIIKPDSSRDSQLITYAVLAMAVTGIFVYHYIKKQEAL